MDEPTNEQPKKDFNQLDLSQLQSFSFGTQWTQEKGEAEARGPRRRSDRPDRPPRDAGAGEEPRRDRRGFRRPHGSPGSAAEQGSERSGSGGAGRRGERGGGGFRDHGGPGAPYRGPRHAGGGSHPGSYERGPYISPHFTIAFYPEDTSFAALAKTIRASCRTFELFDIARTVIGKNDRFVVVVQRRKRDARSGSGEAALESGASLARQPLYVSVPDGMPFETEDAAVDHVMKHHADRFFDAAEVDVDPPKGNYQVINRCGVTGELLGPPNYHRYNQIVQQHHETQLPRMPFDAFRARIESVRDPEIVNQWLEKMRKITRFTSKLDRRAPPPAAAPEPERGADAPASASSGPAEAENAQADTGQEASGNPASQEEASEIAPAAPESATGISFDSLSEARVHLLTQARDKVVRAVEQGRFHGRLLEQMPEGEIRRAIEGALDRQRRFPLDTANALRGRLRREGFTIFKKGSKGISYVCAVKRKFRVPGQTFADSIGQLITFIEEHPMVRASELPQKFLDLKSGGKADEPLPAEQQQRLVRMQGDLRWLVMEGYVTEFIDGGLFAPPPVVEARKREMESGEGDTENFPSAAAEEADSGPPNPEGPHPDAPKESSADSPPPAPEAVRPAAAETPVQPEMPDPAAPAEDSAPAAAPQGEQRSR